MTDDLNFLNRLTANGINFVAGARTIEGSQDIILTPAQALVWASDPDQVAADHFKT